MHASNASLVRKNKTNKHIVQKAPTEKTYAFLKSTLKMKQFLLNFLTRSTNSFKITTPSS